MKPALFLVSLATVFASTQDRSAIHPLPTSEYVIFCLICVGLVLLGGLMSGLTVGLLGIDEIA
jgi:hypothetical protein